MSNARIAKVTSLYPLQVQMDGMASPLNSAPICLVDSLVPGDYVWCEFYDQQLVIMGRISDGSSIRQLGNTENLNDFVWTGVWGQNADANTDTARNYPVKNAGLFEVFRVWPDGHMVQQRYTVYSPNPPSSGLYWRSFYSGTWYPWSQYGAPDSNWVTLTGSVTPASGWSCGLFQARKKGQTCECIFTFTRTGAAIASNSTGNITNTAMGTLTNSTYVPNGNSVGITNGWGGYLWNGYMDSSGIIAVGAVLPNVSISTNDVLYGTAFYFVGP